MLCLRGDMILHSSFVAASEDEDEFVIQLLQKEYGKFALHFPGTLPDFDPDAALFGAKTVFTAAQLLLLRDVPESGFEQYIPVYAGNMHLGAVLSSDLCLRFLPEIIDHAHHIDRHDDLVPHLEFLLNAWPYSSIGRRFVSELPAPENVEVLHTESMRILCSERVIERQAQHRLSEEMKQFVQPFIENYGY